MINLAWSWYAKFMTTRAQFGIFIAKLGPGSVVINLIGNESAWNILNEHEKSSGNA